MILGRLVGLFSGVNFLKGFRECSKMSYPQLGVSKNSGIPKWDGENNGKPYEQMDDFGRKNLLFGLATATLSFR